MVMFDTTQVPIQEPMYVNGHLSQVWHMFFYRLSKVASTDDQVDLTDITQLAHQLPTQATQGQMLIDLGVLKGLQPLLHQQFNKDEMHQPLHAVFLHPDPHAPLANINFNHQAFTQPTNLPTGEVLHDSV